MADALREALQEIAGMTFDKWTNGYRAGEIARAALAATQPQQDALAAPSGYVLAPVEPTDAMMDAAESCSDDWPRTTWKKAWSAMLSSAPAQPGQAETDPRLEAAEDALHKIKQWADAYPATVFIEPDLKRANEVLADAGISMTGMHGTWGRHIAAGMGKIATEALAAIAAQGTADGGA